MLRRMNDQRSHGYELMDGSEKSCVRADGLKNSCVRAVGSESHACELRRCKSRADERVLVSECGKLVELKSFPTVKEIACVKMQT